MSRLRHCFGAAWLFVFGASVVLACGAESNDHGDDAADEGNGGSSAGAATNGGTGGRAGGSGGSDRGGGSATGGSGAVSGSAGATSGESGSDAGGASGSAGAGGTGARRGYQPPDRHVMGCARMCELHAEAMCLVAPPLEQCIEDCEVGILFEVCSTEWNAMFACIEEADSGACSPADTPMVPECNDEAALAYSCVTERGLSGDYAAPCLSHCTAESGSGCANAPQSVDCFNTCVIIASAFPVCASRFESFLDCSGTAEYECNEDGEPFASGCAEEYGAFIDCLDADYGWQPGVGLDR